MLVKFLKATGTHEPLAINTTAISAIYPSPDNVEKATSIAFSGGHEEVVVSVWGNFNSVFELINQGV